MQSHDNAAKYEMFTSHSEQTPITKYKSSPYYVKHTLIFVNLSSIIQ